LASSTNVLLVILGVVSLIVNTACDSSSAAEKPPRRATPAAAAQPAEPPPSPSPPSTAVSFPSVVTQFITMNRLQREEFSKTLKGLVLSGTGTVFQVDACDPLDDSGRWGAKCAKLVLDSGPARVALYFDEKYRAALATYQKDQSLTFTGCAANSVKDWGFGPIATCDMR
jgi:hypothetical protein